MPRNLSRRTLIKTLGVAGLTLPLLSPRLVRAASANSKLNIAFVGTASQARFSIDNLRSENSIAFADVDSNSLGQALKDFPGSRGYDDYRQMLEKEQKNIDAVVVATPDHHHAQAGLRAMALGKHLYCEKPLAHTVHEIQLMIDLAKRNKLATQMGTQIHAGNNYRRVVEKIQRGAIGAIAQVHVYLYGNPFSGFPIPATKEQPPASLNWPLWLGPAPDTDYHAKIYHPFTWRNWWAFGGGGTSDLGCHFCDLPHWALGLRTPATVQAYAPEPKADTPPKLIMVDMHHAAVGERGAVTVTWHLGTQIDGAPGKPFNVYKQYNIDNNKYKGSKILFIGDKGMLIADYGTHSLLPEDQFKGYKSPEEFIPNSIGHHAEWVKACKEGTPTTCNFEYSGALAQSVLLGLVSHRAGNIKIDFDAKAVKTSSAKADEFLTKPYRAGWEIDKIV